MFAQGDQEVVQHSAEGGLRDGVAGDQGECWGTK